MNVDERDKRQPNLRTLGPWQGKYNLKWKHRSQTTWCWLGRGSEKDSSRECHWDTCMWRITSRPTMSQLVVEGKKNLHPAIHLKMTWLFEHFIDVYLSSCWCMIKFDWFLFQNTCVVSPYSWGSIWPYISNVFNLRKSFILLQNIFEKN